MIDGSGRLLADARRAIATSSVPWLGFGVGPAAPSPLRREELLHRKDGASRQHVVNSAADLVREDRQRFALAVGLLKARQDLLPGTVVAQERHCGLGEGPFQMDVAHLGTTGPELLAAGLLGAFDQSGVGGKFRHAIKTCAVMDFVEDREGEHLANTRYRPEPMEGIGIVAFRLPDDRQFEIRDQRLVVIDEGEVDLNALLDARSAKCSTTPARLAL